MGQEVGQSAEDEIVRRNERKNRKTSLVTIYSSPDRRKHRRPGRCPLRVSTPSFPSLNSPKQPQGKQAIDDERQTRQSQAAVRTSPDNWPDQELVVVV